MPTKAEIEQEQKKKWLGEHLPYELMMMRYSIVQLRDQKTFWLDWNAFLSAFAVSACNLAAFLTNAEKKQGNFQAHDFVDSFRSRKEKLAKTFALLEPQVFHLGRARPTDEGKFTSDDAEAINNWIEGEIKEFVLRLGPWKQYWDEKLIESRPSGPMLAVSELKPAQSTSTAEPFIVRSSISPDISK